MKKLLLLCSIMAMVFAFAGNAQAYEPWGYGIYTKSVEPMDYAVPGATLGSKTGTATCKNIFGFVTWGDCSVKAAMKNGRISKVTAADWEKKYILVYGSKTLRVYGN